MIWHILTPEYPPQSGGVSHYVRLLAEGLANSGDEVHVWCPPAQGSAPRTPGVAVHYELGRMTPADLWRTAKALNRFPGPRRIFVQWVPHGYGYRSMNVPFCLWLWARWLFRGDGVELMIHEAFLAFWEGTWRQDVAALVHRAMMMILLRATRHVWMSIPAFEAVCKPYALGRSVTFTWLPLPSTVPVGATAAGIAEVRRRYLTNGQSLVGHFGTFGRQTKPLLDAIIPRLLHDCSKVALLLIGPGSEVFRSLLLEQYPAYSTRIHCTGQIDASDPRLSCHLSACDLMIQPYPDGVTTRRTSIMAPLSHGVPAVTTSGRQTEPFWRDCGALALAPVGDTESFVRTAQELIEDQEKRSRISTAAASLYHRTFDIQEIVATLRGGQSDFAPEPRVPASDKVRVVDRC